VTAPLRFVVPGPPVPKARARVVQRGAGKPRGVTPARTKAYQRTVGLYALGARQRLASWPMDARYRVAIEVCRADKRGDLDNYIKTTLDGLNGVLWADDRLVDEVSARRYPVSRDGGLECLVVEVTPLGATS